MSHSPGIIYQTSRSIRSIHCRQFYFFNSKILVKPFIHSPIPRFPFFLLTRKSWLSLHPRHWIQEYLFHKYSIQVRSGIVKTTCMSNKSLYLIEFYFYWRVKIVIILMHFTIYPSRAMPTHMERTTVLVRSCRIIIIIYYRLLVRTNI